MSKLLLYSAAVLLAVMALLANQEFDQTMPDEKLRNNLALRGEIEELLALEKRFASSENPESLARADTNATGVSDGSQQAPVGQLCTDWGPQFLSCASVYYRTLVEKRGIAVAMADMKSRYVSDGRVNGECHQLTHVVGRAAAAKFERASEAFAEGDSLCWSGYYHGVMEGIVQRGGKKSLTGSVLDGICSDIPGKERFSFDYYNCVHGLGHGIMYLKTNNVFDSLSTCDEIAGVWEQSSCAGGVYMENVIADGREHSSAYLRPEDPLYPCNVSQDKHKTTCYLMQTSYMLKIAKNDFSRVFEMCLGAGEAYLDICYQSLGRDASGQSVSNIARTKASCMLGKDYRAQSNCIVGAVKDFISYHHGDSQARSLCAALVPELQPICTSTADSYVQVL